VRGRRVVMKMRRLVATAVSVLFAASVWAGFFLHGARKAKSDYEAETIATYIVQPCVMISDGSPAGQPATQYRLIKDKDGIALFEREGPAQGAVIENHWVADDGDHFFVWVLGSHAWEYILPTDRTKDGVRLVYPKGSYEKEKGDDDVTKTTSRPTMRCDLKAVTR
jgi:hypothetical protein